MVERVGKKGSASSAWHIKGGGARGGTRGSPEAGNNGGGKEPCPTMAAMASAVVLSASKRQKASEGVGKKLGVHSGVVGCVAGS